MAAPELVAATGVEQLQTPLGNPPPMATSSRMKNPWSTAACQVDVPIWPSVTVW